MHDELSEQVFKILIQEKKSLSFVPGRAKPAAGASAISEQEIEDEGELPQPEEENTDIGLPKRHTDTKLQTSLTPEGLQRRLLDLYQDAQTMLEEQGWFDLGNYTEAWKNVNRSNS